MSDTEGYRPAPKGRGRERVFKQPPPDNATDRLCVRDRLQQLRVPRETLVRLLEDVAGCQCYDSDTTETLIQAVVVNVNDRTIRLDVFESIINEK